MEDMLLKQARALYKDRLRIALAAFIVVFSITFYLFYNPEIISIGAVPPVGWNQGWTQGFAVVASVNTIGFCLSVALIVLIFRFWSWAFLPGPALTYTLAILKGILGTKTAIRHTYGKKIKVTLENGLQFDVNCRIKEKGTDEWFVYRLVSTQLHCEQLRNIALRHGFGVKNNQLVANISNNELHHRTFLLTKALMLASPSI
ncbi:MAG: hypothetical protein KAJ36_05040 [Candidatus Thorarchaeota archaeon]|nr:hypothetical protein [Candidatus Thorarchaeota archaeon]